MRRHYQRTGEELSAETAMMDEPERWPMRSVLPVKRMAETPGDMPETGVLVTPDLAYVLALSPNPYRVYLDVDLGTVRDQLHTAKFLDYAAPEAILADGWVVD